MRLIDAFKVNMNLVEIYNQETDESRKDALRKAMAAIRDAPTITPPPKSDRERPECIEIYWQDLTLTKQREILHVFGENGNWDVFPIATIDVPAEDETEL